MYAPLVEYTQNKQFAGLMETLFGAVEKLQERNGINEGEYLELANLTKKLYEAKTQIQKSVVYIEIVRRAEKKPPQPPKAVDKLNDPNYRTCEFCSKRLHCKFLREHQRTSRSCVEKQQGKRNVKVEKYEVKDERHTRRQAFAVQLIPRYKTGVVNGNRMETVIKIRNDSQGFEREYYENGENYIHNDRIFGVITPPPYQKFDEKIGEMRTIYPSRENHTRANIRQWEELRPETAPTYEPYFQYVDTDCGCCDEVLMDTQDIDHPRQCDIVKKNFCGICMNPTKQKIGGSAVKTPDQIADEIRKANSKKTNKELYEICMSRGIVVNKSYKKDDFLCALVANAFNKKKVEVDEVYAEVAENDMCYTYEKAPKKKKNKKALLIVEDDE
jgi:hypothetical protein